jgi:hypothetical protein
MSKTRNNHYVPQWYQEGFFEPNRNTLAYLDMSPQQIVLNSGTIVTERALFNAPTSRAFRQTDLYSTFFGTSVNDEIERYLFGDIDTRGSSAIRAFAEADVGKWHKHFQTLFEFIDIQKIRTPKGLDWLRAQYPTLSQNDLMMEMQGIRMMHCTIWSEGVREIVSAEEAGVKFIISDHPVTIYNHSASPEEKICSYPNDPNIAQKASQTIFPLNRNFCLIITNLEYARDQTSNPLDKRTFARNYRQSMVRTDAFIRERKLSNAQVAEINLIIKRRARRYVAAGNREWLYPEKIVTKRWSELNQSLLPVKNSLWHFGGEIIAKFDDGRVHFQDEFGRTEKPRDYLQKTSPKRRLKPREACGCGSGRSFKSCCEGKPTELRPTWTELSIRERNLRLYTGIMNVLQMSPDSDWAQVRRDLTDDQISTIYRIYEALWPLETDLLQLLPKPDGTARAVYTGSIHPNTIRNMVLSSPLYFGEMIVQHPFVHAGTVKKEFSPVENPKSYRQEFLNSVVFFLTIAPLVEMGLINLVPDLCNFDLHLRDQMFHLARSRAAGLKLDPRDDPYLEQLMRDDFQRNLMSLPREALQAEMRRATPDITEEMLENVLSYIEERKKRDPLAILQEDTFADGKKGGVFNLMKLAPNFEMTLYLAQATGSYIVTDSAFRWREICKAARLDQVLPDLTSSMEKATFAFPQDINDVLGFAFSEVFAEYPPLMTGIANYLSNIEKLGHKPNREAQLTSRFRKSHASIQGTIEKAKVLGNRARISCAFSSKGIQDNTVNRLLLMSSSEKHRPNAPMAFFVQAAS